MKTLTKLYESSRSPLTIKDLKDGKITEVHTKITKELESKIIDALDSYNYPDEHKKYKGKLVGKTIEDLYDVVKSYGDGFEQMQSVLVTLYPTKFYKGKG